MKTVTATDIGWGEYGSFAGPYYRGISGLNPTLPAGASHLQKIYYVITQTEGGNYSAINMYDVMILTVGAIQWGERAQYSVSKMLGKIMESSAAEWATSCLADQLRLADASFHRNAAGQWRFFFNDERGEVDTVKKQQELFLRCDGHKGSWSTSSTQYAKGWAAAFANIWLNQTARDIQERYTIEHLDGFITKDARPLLLDGLHLSDYNNDSLTSWRGGATAMYMSFAANNPTLASNALIAHCKATKFEKWTPEWCIELAKALTFSSNISIYPIRYAKIAPLIDRIYGTEFPISSNDLKLWKYEEHRGELPTLPEIDPSEIHLSPITVEPRRGDSILPPPPEQSFWSRIFSFLMSLFGGRR